MAQHQVLATSKTDATFLITPSGCNYLNTLKIVKIVGCTKFEEVGSEIELSDYKVKKRRNDSSIALGIDPFWYNVYQEQEGEDEI